MIERIKEFLRLESASGMLLLIAGILAMVAVNSPLSGLYDQLLSTPFEIRLGEWSLGKPLLLWINDGLMAVFFFLIGLELKREMLEGELADPRQIILPGLAAVGGMAVPALIYSYLNWGDDTAMKGWAIPSATDIAFALAVLSLLGNRVPHALKLFLLALAIFDDMGAIIIIALFYTADLSIESLVVATLSLSVLGLLNHYNVKRVSFYVLFSAITWLAVLKSGVHATLAGVLVALFIPLRLRNEQGRSMLERLEHELHPTVAFIILPVFAFANTGISLENLSLSDLTDPVPLGIALGLFLGNQIGVLGMSWAAIKIGIAKMPNGSDWWTLYGVAMLCGIGFTMSLFISSLAFESGAMERTVDDRLGILLGSIISAVCGYFWLKWRLPPAAPEQATK